MAGLSDVIAQRLADDLTRKGLRVLPEEVRDVYNREYHLLYEDSGEAEAIEGALRLLGLRS